MGVMERRRALMGMGLPGIYQAVEYIESDAHQYIDTDIPVQTDINIKLSVLYYQADNAMFAGGYRIDNNNYSVRIGTGFYSNNLQGYYGNYYYQGTILNRTKYDITLHFEEGLQEAWIDGVKQEDKNYRHNASLLPIDQSKANFSIFAEGRTLADGTKTHAFSAKGRLYSLEVSNAFGKLGNFIPCYRKSDGEIGLYDTVKRKFYMNQGSQPFIKGNDI